MDIVNWTIVGLSVVVVIVGIIFGVLYIIERYIDDIDEEGMF